MFIIADMQNEIKAYSLTGLKQLVSDAGLPSFRASQLAQWLYLKNATSYEEMTNLPSAVRSQFTDAYPLFVPQVEDRQISSDGTVKYLLRFHDGALVETVAMPSLDGRLTVCCSSQSGCAMHCSFCATGRLGLTRSLLPGEIVDQVLIAQDDMNQRVSNIVIMGQGEPFANYVNTLNALRILNDKKLLNIGARHITVSTCGLIPGIERFSEEPEQFTLAISLHSANQQTRDSLMPSCKSYPLDDLKNALSTYIEKTGRRISFEYALMKGINDSDGDLRELIEYCKGLLCHVNIIPLNPIHDSPYKPVSKSVMAHWSEALESVGISTTIRNSRGSDIAGACGQLSSQRQSARL